MPKFLLKMYLRIISNYRLFFFITSLQLCTRAKSVPPKSYLVSIAKQAIADKINTLELNSAISNTRRSPKLTEGEINLREKIDANTKLVDRLTKERNYVNEKEKESVDHFISQVVKVTDEMRRVLIDDRIPPEYKNLEAINPNDLHLQHLLERYYGLFISHDKPKTIGNREYKHMKLVKRKVPLGYEGPKFEFDDASGTMYRPLIKAMQKPRNFKPRSQGFSLTDEKNIETLSKAIARFLYSLRPLADQEGDDEAHHLREKSGEDYDPFAPTKWLMRPYHDPFFDHKESILESQAPKHKLWSQWTYYKPTLGSDPCPGLQVWLSDMCVKVPPHYRRLLFGQ